MRLLCLIALISSACANEITYIDLAGEKQRQVIVDREKGQYLGHPTTALLDDGRTVLCVYPKGHGRGPILYKRSTDGERPGANACRPRRAGRPPGKCRPYSASLTLRARNASSCFPGFTRSAWQSVRMRVPTGASLRRLVISAASSPWAP